MAKITAQLRYLRMTPRKVRLLSGVLKGLSANEAEAQLLLQSRRAVKPLLKLLRSAVANAKNSKKFNVAKLYVESIRVDQGPMLKRSLPRARGSASPIQRKMSHVTLVLGEKMELPAPRFTIIIPKKTKLPPKEGSKKKKGKQEKSETEHAAKPTQRQKSQGFFRKVFSRKSGM